MRRIPSDHHSEHHRRTCPPIHPYVLADRSLGEMAQEEPEEDNTGEMSVAYRNGWYERGKSERQTRRAAMALAFALLVFSAVLVWFGLRR